MKIRTYPLGPDEASFAPEHGAIYVLLGELISQRRLDGTECREQGHVLARNGRITANDVGDRRVIAAGFICTVCEKIVTESDSFELVEDDRLVDQLERETVRDVMRKMRKHDRGHR